MHSALRVLKPLLIKWSIVGAVFCFVGTSWLMSVSAQGENGVKKSKKPRQPSDMVKSLPPYNAETADYSDEVVALVNKTIIPGNDYDAGNCTWYVKHRRPDLPNGMGDANHWISSAKAHGIPTGSQPKIGAIGASGMHVVYVENLNGDGTIEISEMNYQGLGVISHRTLPASMFKYIY